MLFTFLLVVQAIIAFALVTVVLMQRSEGGGLGMGGGSPSGLMSARGAADFLTRATGVLAALFVGMSIVLAVIAATQHRAATLDTSLVGQQGSTTRAPTSETGGDALSGAAAVGASNGAAAGNQAVPLAQ
jgi:preprotein translocase subunit SecG